MPEAANIASTPIAEPRGDFARLRAAIDAGFLLPTRWYADPAIFQAELERIHRRAWHFATHVGDVANAGDVYVRNVAGVPIVLVRGADGGVRGFLNICRHRGHPVVMQSGNESKLRCSFHAWTYGLDGALQHAPRSRGDASFDPAQFGLVPIQTHVWGPMVWVNLDAKAPAFDAWIAGMPELMRSRGLEVEEQAFGFDHAWDVDANWKVFQDNTIECYHCPTTHPELARVLEMRPDLQTFQVGGRYWIHHTIPFRRDFEGSLTTRKVEGVPFHYYYHWVFPTTYIQYAGRGFDVGSLDVVAVDRIRFRHVCFMPRGTSEETLAKGRRQLARDATIQQDVGLCNRVQLGHASGLAPTNRVLREPEFLLSHFHRVILDMMEAGGAAA
jgi:phenylpropionate dioxygenase-like ring-hydroxylating dioxygenase large terminal subunit